MKLQEKENILIKANEFNIRFCIDKIIKDEIHHNRDITQYRIKGWIWEEDINTFNDYILHPHNIDKFYNIPLSINFEIGKYFESISDTLYIEGESLWLNKIIKDNYIELEIYFIN